MASIQKFASYQLIQEIQDDCVYKAQEKKFHMLEEKYKRPKSTIKLISWIVYRIFNAFKHIFGKSDWQITHKNWQHVKKIHGIFREIQTGKGLSNDRWQKLSLDEQCVVGRIISRNLHLENYRKASTTIYRNLKNNGSSREIEMQLERMHDRFAYFHGTKSEESVLSILNSRKIKVNHKGNYPGVFVSTQPELRYGPFFFGFKRQIEWEHSLKTAWRTRKHQAYWAGFSEPISTDPRTLECIMIARQDRESDDDVAEKCKKLQSRIKKQLNRDIAVLPLFPILDTLKEEECPLSSAHRCIPKHWPETYGNQPYVDAHPSKMKKNILIHK